MSRWLLTAAILALACPPAASAAAPDLPLPAAPARATPALERLRAALGRMAVVRPGVVAGREGPLTPRSARAPGDVALRGGGAPLGGFAELRLARRYRSLDGVTHLVWEQRVDGVP